jgi:hypothetical protein
MNSAHGIAMAKRHPDKHIREALKTIDALGWTVVEGRGHAFAVIRCPHEHGGCQKSVWSTPRNPEAHARDLLRFVESCPH